MGRERAKVIFWESWIKLWGRKSVSAAENSPFGHIMTQQCDAAEWGQHFCRWIAPPPPPPPVPIQAQDQHPAYAILNQRQHTMPLFVLTALDRSVSLWLAACLCASAAWWGAGDYHRSWITEDSCFINVFTVPLSTRKKGIVTANRSQGWLICSRWAPPPEAPERKETTYTDWDICLRGGQWALSREATL